ncbi:MAG TPA: hypothetical protein DCM87_05730 [Planctomycetes bacterium]|nr:hypothetical protein [Planctomycetota bacterium]
MYFIENGSDRTEMLRARRQSLARFLGLGARLVLEASEDLDRVLGHALGRQKLIGCLNGADSGFMHALELTGLPHYGVFRSMRRQWVARLIDFLQETGYLRVAGQALRPVVLLGEEAEELLRNPEEAPLLPQEILDDATLGPAWPRSAAEERLRRIRLRVARLLARPPRQVMSDDLVRALSIETPASKADVEARLPDVVKPHAELVWSAVSPHAAAAS